MYIKKRLAGRNKPGAMRLSRGFGLGGASDCGADQMFYPNLTFAGITGQCSTPAAAQQAISSGAATGNLSGAQSPGGGGGIADAAAKFFGGLLSGATSSPAAVPVAQTGMGTTTKIALAGGAIVVLALIARR